MKRLFRRLLAGLAVIFLVACVQHIRLSGEGQLPSAAPDSLRAATLNVHYIVLSQQSGAWSVGDWEDRRNSLDAAFKHIDADLFAFQEMESFQRGSDGSVNLARDWLLARNSGYALAAHGPWQEFPPTQPIFYKTERLEMLEQGWFFFSDTPDVIYSRTFNGSWPAFASWARMKDKTSGRAFYAINVHFEYRSASNRRLSAELVAKRIAPWIKSGAPVMLLGDLNARAGSETMRILQEAGLSFTPVPGATYHLNRGLNLFGAIDHIALANGFEPRGAPVVLRQKFEGRWPTDHYPVVLDVDLNP